MTIGLVLTVIFLALKLVFHAIDWPLWTCFLPLIIEGGIELLIVLLVFCGVGAGVVATVRDSRKSKKRRKTTRTTLYPY